MTLMAPASLALAGCAGAMQARPLGEAIGSETDAASQRAGGVAFAVYRAGPAVRTFAVDGSDARLRRERTTPGDEARWTDTVSRAETPGARFEPIRVAEFGFADDGAVRLFASDNLERGVRTVFEPPLIVCPADLPVGSVHRHETTLTTTTDTGDGVRTQTGEAAVETERLAPERVEIAGEPVDTERVDIRLTLSIDRAEVSRSTRYAFTFDRGVLADDTAERVRALGFTVRSETRTARAIED